MDKIISLFSDPAWWFTAIVVAILVNLVSAGIPKLVRKGAERVGATRLALRLRLQSAEQSRRDAVERSRTSSDERSIVAMIILRAEIRMVMWSVAGVMTVLAYILIPDELRSARNGARGQGITIALLAGTFLSAFNVFLQALKSKQWGEILAEGYKAHGELSSSEHCREDSNIQDADTAPTDVPTE